ncbi:MAG: HlyC/CorC family transporter [Planctomycetota bacterium]|nr:MAG: HlyC/CorC family transporter [Planctomycetota bacterium]
MVVLTWLGVAACLLHSAVFSGLNLALFGPSRLQLEVEAEGGNQAAMKVIALRRDSNWLLTTILWGNVAANCLLTLLTDSVLTGLYGFMFSTIGITFFGEIIPQAWFSRNALKMGAALAPVLKVYRALLWPVAKPSAWLLDRWLGKEGITYLREHDLRRVIAKHMEADEADLEVHEGRGALNFLALDDLPVSREGEPVDPDSVIVLPANVDLPVLPECDPSPEDPFVQQVAQSGHKWVILCNEDEEPLLVLDADEFLRSLFLDPQNFHPYRACHRPIVVRNSTTTIGRILNKLKVRQQNAEDDVIDEDLILVWTDKHRRVVTGADLLGFLLRGIVPVAGGVKS